MYEDPDEDPDYGFSGGDGEDKETGTRRGSGQSGLEIQWEVVFTCHIYLSVASALIIEVGIEWGLPYHTVKSNYDQTSDV